MRFAVETWAPDYGQPVDDAVLGEPEADVDLAVEVAPDDWAPDRPGGRTGGPGAVRRRRAAGRRPRVGHRRRRRQPPGRVRQLGRRRRRVRRPGEGGRRPRCAAACSCPAEADLDAIVTAHDTYHPYAVRDGRLHRPRPRQRPGRPRGAGGGGSSWPAAPTAATGDAAGAGPDDLVVVDGPLRGHRHLPGAVGYVKAHHVAYLPPAQQLVVGRPALGPAHAALRPRRPDPAAGRGTCGCRGRRRTRGGASSAARRRPARGGRGRGAGRPGGGDAAPLRQPAPQRPPRPPEPAPDRRPRARAAPPARRLAHPRAGAAPGGGRRRRLSPAVSRPRGRSRSR